MKLGVSLFFKFLVCILFFSTSCTKENSSPDCEPLPLDFVPSFTQSLFLELTFDQEFGQSTDRLRKWEEDILVFIEGTAPAEVLAEIDAVIALFNTWGSNISIEKVASQEEANLRIFLGLKEDYVALLEPQADGIAQGNSGFATIAWNNQNEIIRASACIDVVNFSDSSLLKHVVREELAQTLGLINDTVLDDNSIFYQFGSTATVYSESDERLIRYMLGDDLEAGMCPTEALDFVQ